MELWRWHDARAAETRRTPGGPAVELNPRLTDERCGWADEQSGYVAAGISARHRIGPNRDATTTPLQQLFVLNSEFVET